jgi:hypothetical protein
MSGKRKPEKQTRSLDELTRNCLVSGLALRKLCECETPRGIVRLNLGRLSVRMPSILATVEKSDKAYHWT